MITSFVKNGFNIPTKYSETGQLTGRQSSTAYLVGYRRCRTPQTYAVWNPHDLCRWVWMVKCVPWHKVSCIFIQWYYLHLHSLHIHMYSFMQYNSIWNQTTYCAVQ